MNEVLIEALKKADREKAQKRAEQMEADRQMREQFERGNREAAEGVMSMFRPRGVKPL